MTLRCNMPVKNGVMIISRNAFLDSFHLSERSLRASRKPHTGNQACHLRMCPNRESRCDLLIHWSISNHWATLAGLDSSFLPNHTQSTNKPYSFILSAKDMQTPTNSWNSDSDDFQLPGESCLAGFHLLLLCLLWSLLLIQVCILKNWIIRPTFWKPSNIFPSHSE